MTADVRQPRVLVPAEVSLADLAVLGPVEDRAPGLELPDPVRRLLACSSAIRQLFRDSPPRMVSRKCTCQLSFGFTLPMAAAQPPSAMTVCALPNRDLEMIAVRSAPPVTLQPGGVPPRQLRDGERHRRRHWRSADEPILAEARQRPGGARYSSVRTLTMSAVLAPAILGCS